MPNRSDLPKKESSRVALARHHANCKQSMRPMRRDMGHLPVIADTECGRGVHVKLPCGKDALIAKSDLEISEREA